jgi:hypothetical protein
VTDPAPGQATTAAILATAEMVRQNDYLKLRNAQLQEDVAGLAADNERLRQELERIVGRRALRLAAEAATTTPAGDR